MNMQSQAPHSTPQIPDAAALADLEREARLRQLAVESRKKRKTAVHAEQSIPPTLPLPANPMLRELVEQEKRLAEEIAQAKSKLAEFESLKAENRSDVRVLISTEIEGATGRARRRRWPQTNPEFTMIIIDYSDDEDEDCSSEARSS